MDVISTQQSHFSISEEQNASKRMHLSSLQVPCQLLLIHSLASPLLDSFVLPSISENYRRSPSQLAIIASYSQLASYCYSLFLLFSISSSSSRVFSCILVIQILGISGIHIAVLLQLLVFLLLLLLYYLVISQIIADDGSSVRIREGGRREPRSQGRKREREKTAKQKKKKKNTMIPGKVEQKQKGCEYACMHVSEFVTIFQSMDAIPIHFGCSHKEKSGSIASCEYQ